MKDQIIIRLHESGLSLAPFLFASISPGGPLHHVWQPFHQKGYVQFFVQPFTALSLKFEFCPERFTELPVTEGNQLFVIRPEPTLFEMFFSGFFLELHTDYLTGGHPVLEGQQFVYSR